MRKAWRAATSTLLLLLLSHYAFADESADDAVRAQATAATAE